MKKTAGLLWLIGACLSLLFSFACKSMPTEDLKKFLEVTDVETKWVSKYYQPWPPRLILVPAISFRIKNAGPRPLNYINFNAVFKFKGEVENLGDNFMAAIRKEHVKPGEKSPVIVLKSNFGVEGKNLHSFSENIMWKPAVVKIFAQSKGSRFVLLGEWDVSRTIDFKEPEPVEINQPKTSETH